MKIGLILFILGLVLALYLLNVSLNKLFIKRVAIIISLLMLLYGLILVVQPDDYIEFTKTTIAK